MNPIVHAELSWLMSQRLEARRDRLLVVCAGLAPDLDGLGLLGGEELYARYHHLLFHGYVGALVTAGVCTALARQRGRVALSSLLAFHLHLLCDLAGSGPGWPIWYFWPTSGLEWFWEGQWDLASWQNSLIGLVATLACLACALRYRRTPVELFSSRWDAEVVRTLRLRFLGEGRPSP
jgi:inner membrane protein